MRPPIVLALATASAMLLAWTVGAWQGRPTDSPQEISGTAPPRACRAAGPLVRVAGLPEGSGVAASRRDPGVVWAHNDSGEPTIVALDPRGAVLGRVGVAGAAVTDWEDIAVGPCPQGSCVYIGDIGDNDHERPGITVYRTAEPAAGDRVTQPAEAFHASYPDGPHDAEALFVTADADVFIITKGDPGPIRLYRLPRPLRAGARVALEPVGDAVGGAKVEAGDRITGADASPDGRWVTVRTTKWVAVHPLPDLVAGRWREVFRADLSSLSEPRGEGVTFAGPGTLLLVGEGGGGPSGTFARLDCTFGQ